MHCECLVRLSTSQRGYLIRPTHISTQRHIMWLPIPLLHHLWLLSVLRRYPACANSRHCIDYVLSDLVETFAFNLELPYSSILIPDSRLSFLESTLSVNDRFLKLRVPFLKALDVIRFFIELLLQFVDYMLVLWGLLWVCRLQQTDGLAEFLYNYNVNSLDDGYHRKCKLRRSYWVVRKIIDAALGGWLNGNSLAKGRTSLQFPPLFFFVFFKNLKFNRVIRFTINS